MMKNICEKVDFTRVDPIACRQEMIVYSLEISLLLYVTGNVFQLPESGERIGIASWQR